MASLYASSLTAPPNTHLSLFPLPRPTGNVLDFVTSPDSITIVRTSDFNHYIEPPADPGQIRKDLVMTGFVVVHMSRKVRARRLRVRFVAEATLAFPGGRRGSIRIVRAPIDWLMSMCGRSSMGGRSDLRADLGDGWSRRGGIVARCRATVVSRVRTTRRTVC